MGALKNNRGPRLKSLNEISDGLIESILKITDGSVQLKDQNDRWPRSTKGPK